MTWIPQFKLYDKDSNFIMILPAVFYTNAPQTQNKFTLVEGIRGDGGIVVEGSKATWDLIIKGNLFDNSSANNYQAVTVLIDNLESNFPVCVTRIVKIDKTPSTTYTYKVKRLVKIEYPESLRNTCQEYQLTLKVITP